MTNPEDITRGTRVKLINPRHPKHSNVPLGAIGVAEEEPHGNEQTSLFWVKFPTGRMHVRVREIEVVK